MESESDVPEDGEIVDYEPLPRPTVASSMKPNDSFRSVVRETGTSDSSDSCDSDCGGTSRKKPKIRKNDNRRSKYNVWASEFQTSELMDEICNWETGLKNRVMDRSRNVESYYHLPPEENELEVCGKGDMRKRRHGEEVVDLRTKLGRRQSKERDDHDIHPRYLSELRVTSDDSVEDVTQDITSKLCEEKEELVSRVVTVLGSEKAIAVFNKTRVLEEGGGMMVMNGSRRRTPGGVFLQLIKRDEDIPKDHKNKIFMDEQRMANKNRKSRNKHQKKKSEVKTSVLADDNVEEEDLPVLLTRQEIAIAQSSDDVGSPMDDSALPTVTAEETNQRQITVYDDTFDDAPCEGDFT